MDLPVIHIFTHDSIGLGEDGPTHQPVEHLASLRAIPGLNVIRPCDANEVGEAWRITMVQHHQPVALVLTRQDVLALSAYEELIAHGVAARVVSLPSWYLFDQQPEDYRDEVLPPAITAR